MGLFDLASFYIHRVPRRPHAKPLSRPRLKFLLLQTVINKISFTFLGSSLQKNPVSQRQVSSPSSQSFSKLLMSKLKICQVHFYPTTTPPSLLSPHFLSQTPPPLSFTSQAKCPWKRWLWSSLLCHNSLPPIRQKDLPRPPQIGEYCAQSRDCGDSRMDSEVLHAGTMGEVGG